MNKYDATEIAYMNGFEEGLKAAEKDKTKLAHKNRKLVHTNAKLARMERAARQENAELRDQVYNLTLYLQDALHKLDRLNTAIHCDGSVINYTIAFNEDYDGLPGYTPEILEARNERL